MSETLLTFKELAESWKVSERTIMRLIAAKKLAVVYVGASPRIREAEAQDYLNRQSGQPSVDSPEAQS